MNKIEEYKREKDGLDILQDIPRYATEGWETITDGDKERLKWAGVFFRRQTPGRFMMRLRIPIVAAVSRVATVHYAEIVASIASKSAGPGTRANIDEFTETTARAIETVGEDTASNVAATASQRRLAGNADLRPRADITGAIRRARHNRVRAGLLLDADDDRRLAASRSFAAL